jgi:hypothetical protein
MASDNVWCLWHEGGSWIQVVDPTTGVWDLCCGSFQEMTWCKNKRPTFFGASRRSVSIPARLIGFERIGTAYLRDMMKRTRLMHLLLPLVYHVSMVWSLTKVSVKRDGCRPTSGRSIAAKRRRGMTQSPLNTSNTDTQSWSQRRTKRAPRTRPYVKRTNYPYPSHPEANSISSDFAHLLHARPLLLLLGIILSLQLVVLQDIHHLPVPPVSTPFHTRKEGNAPRIVDPHILDIHPREIRNALRNLRRLLLQLVVHDKDAKLGALRQPRPFGRVGDERELGGNVLDELLERVRERFTRVVNLVDDEDPLAEETAVADFAAELREESVCRASVRGGKGRTVEKSSHCVRMTSVPITSSVVYRGTLVSTCSAPKPRGDDSHPAGPRTGSTRSPESGYSASCPRL